MSKAARMAGMDRMYLHRLVQKHGLRGGGRPAGRRRSAGPPRRRAEERSGPSLGGARNLAQDAAATSPRRGRRCRHRRGHRLRVGGGPDQHRQHDRGAGALRRGQGPDEGGALRPGVSEARGEPTAGPGGRHARRAGALLRGAGQDGERLVGLEPRPQQRARRAPPRFREKLSLDHIRALEAALPRVRVVVDSPAAGTEVRRDGAIVDRALWGTAVPVDPGEHPFDARAPGKRPWQSTVVVRPGPSTVDVVVPRLEDEPIAAPAPPAPAPASAPPPAPAPAPSTPSSLRLWSYVVGGAGVASLAVGAGLAAAASSKWSDAHAHCGGDRCTDPTFLNEGSDAGKLADFATGFVVAGGVGAATGVVLFLLSGGHATATTGAIHVTPAVGATNGLVLGGAF